MDGSGCFVGMGSAVFVGKLICLFSLFVCFSYVVNYGASTLDLLTDENCRSSDYNELRLLQEKAKCFAKFSMVGNFWTFFRMVL